MELIYQNFDGLDVSFQGAVPDYILHQLEEARQDAERSPRGKTPALIYIGKNQVPVHVASTGMKNGYRYRFDTGLDGEIWCIAKDNKPTEWNIRVSVKSLSLALHGYKGVKKRIYEMLDNLDARGSGEKNPKTGEIYAFPREAISRVDYCFDFKSGDFQINPQCLLAHSRFKRQDLSIQDVITVGRQIVYTRIGSIKNKQIVLYDKIREIQEKNKPFWWQIWGIEKEKFDQKIWRVEARAGKKELKKWGIRSFDDFEEKIGDAILTILKEIKYVTPNSNDTNSARWPLAPIWQIAQDSTKNALKDYISNAERKPVIEEYKNTLINRYKNQFAGMLPAYSALKGKEEAGQIPPVLEELFTELSENAAKNKSKIQQKMEKAKNKFVFLDEN